MTRRRFHQIVGRLIVGGLASGAATAKAQAPSTDIYVYRLVPKANAVINITKRAGYDNQPVIMKTGLIFYTQQGNNQTDIFSFDFGTGSTRSEPVTRTPESEYSAAPTPDGMGFAVVRVEMDSAQRLWRFPFDGGPPALVLPDIKPVGYFAYLDSITLALFVLGSPNTLQIADTRTGRGVVAATNIGRSLQRVPGSRRVSFTQRAGSRSILEMVDPSPRADGTFAIDTVAMLPDSAEYVVWRSARSVITGAGSRLLQLDVPSREWVLLADLAPYGVRRISRLAISPLGDLIAFVADEPVP